MSQKTIIGRAIQKHDIEKNWLKAVNFTPYQGEIIVYDIDDNYDYERIKIGDGKTNVNDLPFATDHIQDQLEEHTHNWNDVQEKPFEKVASSSSTVLYDGEVTTSNQREDGVSSLVVDTTGSITLKKDCKYIVSFNGNRYECEVTQDYSSVTSVPIDTVFYVLGNISFPLPDDGEDTGEPFAINYTEIENMGNIFPILQVCTNLGVGTYSLKIEEYPVVEKFTGVIEYENILNKPTKLSEFENDLNIVTSWNDLEDKPFYDTSKVTELCNGTYEFADASESGEDIGIYGNIQKLYTREIVENEKLVVVYDDNVYNFTAKPVYSASSMQMNTYAGNNAILAEYCDIMGLQLASDTIEDTGEPICIWEGSILTKNTESIHTISISLVEGEFKQLDEKFIPDTIARVEDIPEAPQSDWSVNDETNPAYIKNRPFYNDEVQEETCYDGELQFTEFMLGLYMADLYDTSTFTPYIKNMTEGEVLVVYFDNVRYEVVVQKEETMRIYAGNPYIMSSVSPEIPEFEDNGIPFFISEFMMLVSNSEPTHNVTIIRTSGNIKTLDSQYLNIPVREVIVRDSDTAIKALIMNDINHNIASGEAAIASGSSTNALGYTSFAHGNYTTAAGNYSVALGFDNEANGSFSFVAGSRNTASGENSFAIGNYTTAIGQNSFVSGEGLVANSKNLNVFGKYNSFENVNYVEYVSLPSSGVQSWIVKEYYVADSYTFDQTTGKYTLINPEVITVNEGIIGKFYIETDSGNNGEFTSISRVINKKDNYGYVIEYRYAREIGEVEGKYAHIVGNGTSNTDRSNAHTLDWEGNAWFAGKVFVGGTSQDDENAKTLATTPDWNENDETSSAYIQNRPFYTTDPQSVTIIDDTFAFSILGDKSGTQIPFNHSVSEGDEVTLIIDETEYNTIVKLSGSLKYIGNMSLLSSNMDDTGESYLVGLDMEGSAMFMLNDTSKTEHHIKFMIYMPVDITIPNKYLGIDVRKGEGKNSVIIGDNGIATGYNSVSFGANAIGDHSFAAGAGTASGYLSHAEGYGAKAEGYAAFSIGDYTEALGADSFAAGVHSKASGHNSFAIGIHTEAFANTSYSEGIYNIANTRYQHVQGKYNKYEEIELYKSSESIINISINNLPTNEFISGDSYSFDSNTGYYTINNAITTTELELNKYIIMESENGVATSMYKVKEYVEEDSMYILTAYKSQLNSDIVGKYAHIVGNGTSDTKRSNAHTLDWQGNAEYQGDVIAYGCESGETPISLKELYNTIQALQTRVAELESKLQTAIFLEE